MMFNQGVLFSSYLNKPAYAVGPKRSVRLRNGKELVFSFLFFFFNFYLRLTLFCSVAPSLFRCRAGSRLSEVRARIFNVGIIFY